jgi:hypothetical protein
MSNDSDSSLTEFLSDDFLSPAQLASQAIKTSDNSVKGAGKAHVHKRRATIVAERVDEIEVPESNQVELDLTEQQASKRKWQRKQTESNMPLAPRISSLLRIGAHVSAAKGVQYAVTNAVRIG